MKKIVMTAALAIASFGAFAVGTAQSVNTMQIVVPQVLSVTAIPSYQALYLTAESLNGSTITPLQDMAYNIKSNATFNIVAGYSFELSPSNNPSAAERTASLNAFGNAMEFSIDGSTWGSLNSIAAFNPTTQNNVPHTTFAGSNWTLKGRVKNLGMNAVPGVYTTTVTVTLTQP